MNEFTYLDNLSGAYAESRILHAAVELNIFDAIGENRMSVQGISKRLKTNERATELFLNALTALNLLHKKDNLFSLTDLAKGGEGGFCLAARILSTNTTIFFWI